MSPFGEVPGFADLPFPARLTARSLASGVYYYGWVEQTFDPGTGAYADLAVSPREGTTALSPALERNNALVPFPCYVEMRLRAVVGGAPLFEFTAPPSVGGTITGPVTYTNDVVFEQDVTLGGDLNLTGPVNNIVIPPSSTFVIEASSGGGTPTYKPVLTVPVDGSGKPAPVFTVPAGGSLAFALPGGGSIFNMTVDAGGTVAAAAFAAPVSLPTGSTYAGGVPVTGSGTTGRLPVLTGGSVVGDSMVTQVSSSVLSLDNGPHLRTSPNNNLIIENRVAGNGLTWQYDDNGSAVLIDDTAHDARIKLNGSVLADASGIAASWLPALNAITAPTADVSFNGHKATNLANGTAATDAATYGQLQNFVNGAKWKDPVLVLADSDITLSGEQAVDGVTTSASRVAVVGQTAGSQNGLYVSAAGAWTRAADLPAGADAAGVAFMVEKGTTYHDRQFACNNDPGGATVGTDALAFSQIGAATTYTASGGVLLVGNNFVADFGSGAGKVTQGNDARLSDSRAPSGAAGGQLAGTYPDPALNVHGLTLADPAPEDELPLYDVSGAANARASLTLALALNRGQPGLRLTLTAGVPVTTADVTGATAVKYSPYLHDMVCLWNGTAWGWYAIAEKSLSLGTVTASLPYDVFLTYDSANFTLTKLAWSTATARATALTYQDGRLCKSGDKASLYLGTVYTTSTTATEDSATTRGCWNMYNRVTRAAKVASGSGHTYNSGTVRAWNNSTANRVSVLLGLAEEPLQISLACDVQNVANELPDVGWGVDSTTAATLDLFQNSASVIRNRLGRSDSYMPTAGLHYYQALESVTVGTGNNSFNVFWLDIAFRG